MCSTEWSSWKRFGIVALVAGCALDTRSVGSASNQPPDTQANAAAGDTGGVRDGQAGAPAAAPPAGDESSTEGGGAAELGVQSEDGCAGLPLSQCECSVGETTTCGDEYVTVGVCALRVLECAAPGLWPSAMACQPQSDELCGDDGLDENCDGQVDEDCECLGTQTRLCGTRGLSTETCASGRWGACLCEDDARLDLNANGIPDVSENLVRNGNFASDLDGWLQSQRDNVFDGTVYELVATDAAGAACSGSMQLTSTENSGDNFASQCVPGGAGRYSASVQALLLSVGITRTAAFDPSVVTLELAAYSNADCTGDPLLEARTEMTLEVDQIWRGLNAALDAPNGTQAIELRGRVVADDNAGNQSYATRVALFDDFLLRPD